MIVFLEGLPYGRLEEVIHRMDAAANPYSSGLRDAAQRLRSVANKCEGSAKADSLFASSPEYREAALSEFESLIANAVGVLRGMRR